MSFPLDCFFGHLVFHRKFRIEKSWQNLVEKHFWWHFSQHDGVRTNIKNEFKHFSYRISSYNVCYEVLMPNQTTQSPFYSAPSIFAVLRNLVQEIWFANSGWPEKRWFYTTDLAFFRLEKSGWPEKKSEIAKPLF